MEAAFAKLQSEGKNNSQNLVQWMKEAKIIENTKEAEEKAIRMFGETADKQSIELAKFKEVLGKVATEQKKSVEDFTTSLAAEGDKMLNKLKAGAAAFLEAVQK